MTGTENGTRMVVGQTTSLTVQFLHKELESIFDALGHQQRIQMALFAASRGLDGVDTPTFCEVFSMPKSTATTNLEKLVAAGILFHRRQGRFAYYLFNFDLANRLGSFFQNILVLKQQSQ